jgi:hypothetical protein
MEVSGLTAELPGKVLSFHCVPFIQRARSGHPWPKAVPAAEVRFGTQAWPFSAGVKVLND